MFQGFGSLFLHWAPIIFHFMKVNSYTIGLNNVKHNPWHIIHSQVCVTITTITFRPPLPSHERDLFHFVVLQYYPLSMQVLIYRHTCAGCFTTQSQRIHVLFHASALTWHCIYKVYKRNQNRFHFYTQLICLVVRFCYLTTAGVNYIFAHVWCFRS